MWESKLRPWWIVIFCDSNHDHRTSLFSWLHLFLQWHGVSQSWSLRISPIHLNSVPQIWIWKYDDITAQVMSTHYSNETYPRSLLQPVSLHSMVVARRGDAPGIRDPEDKTKATADTVVSTFNTRAKAQNSRINFNKNLKKVAFKDLLPLNPEEPEISYKQPKRPCPPQPSSLPLPLALHCTVHPLVTVYSILYY